jgi:hypothetical protein
LRLKAARFCDGSARPRWRLSFCPNYRFLGAQHPQALSGQVPHARVGAKGARLS